jgi:hypothetical protein
MKRFLSVVLCVGLLLTFTGCPDPKTGKVDPYLTADNAIAFAKTSLVLADTTFQNVLAYAGLEGAKLDEAKAIYKKTRGAVDKALDAAKVALDIAKKNKDGVDVAALLADTDKAWAALTALVRSILPEGGVSGPQSVGSIDKADKPDLTKLPKSIIPK